MRIYRRDDMDLEASPAPQPRNELLRELVDGLPADQQLVVSLYYFGAVQKTIRQIAEETHMSTSRVKGLLGDAFNTLRPVLQDNGLGPVPAED